MNTTVFPARAHLTMSKRVSFLVCLLLLILSSDTQLFAAKGRSTTSSFNKVARPSAAKPIISSRSLPSKPTLGSTSAGKAKATGQPKPVLKPKGPSFGSRPVRRPYSASRNRSGLTAKAKRQANASAKTRVKPILGQRGTLKPVFNKTASRGSLKAGFNKLAKQGVRPSNAPIRPQPPKAKGGMRKSFSRNSKRGLIVKAFAKAKERKASGSKANAKSGKASQRVAEGKRKLTLTQKFRRAKSVVNAKKLAPKKGSFWTSTRAKNGRSARTAVENMKAKYGQHGSQFKDASGKAMYATSTAYAKAAIRFVSNPPKGTLERLRPADGSRVLYHPQSNTMVIQRVKDGAIRTMYKPDPKSHKKPTNMDHFLFS